MDQASETAENQRRGSNWRAAGCYLLGVFLLASALKSDSISLLAVSFGFSPFILGLAYQHGLIEWRSIKIVFFVTAGLVHLWLGMVTLSWPFFVLGAFFFWRAFTTWMPEKTGIPPPV